MNLIICTEVFRDEGKPLFQVSMYDIDRPVNFHSYECYFFRKGRDLNALLEEANNVRQKELKAINESSKIVINK